MCRCGGKSGSGLNMFCSLCFASDFVCRFLGCTGRKGDEGVCWVCWVSTMCLLGLRGWIAKGRSSSVRVSVLFWGIRDTLIVYSVLQSFLLSAGLACVDQRLCMYVYRNYDMIYINASTIHLTEARNRYDQIDTILPGVSSQNRVDRISFAEGFRVLRAVSSLVESGAKQNGGE